MCDYPEEWQQPDPINERFKVVNFVSGSKGKGRKRKHPVEVTLVRDTWDRGWHEPHCFPWDTKCTESGMSESELIDRLVGRYAHRIK